ncbi:MAG: F0F1 ATP synthase subunit epsilon [Clostridia bacterium]|nr:F0F1 ATP synthase subunit epsilon [Clostridia bacterium]MBQ9703619.1 F0F1 ATP synthase subunit epsilon [Clostridia bacterium]
MKTFEFVASTPNGNVFSQTVLEISVRGTEGSLGVRADHIPFITSVKGGTMRITTPDGDDLIANITDGILTVTKEKTTLLCGDFEITD